jgi:type I restriction enzyme S subunit
MSRKSGKPTSTGGREATTRHIPPKLALSVGMPSSLAPPRWKWSALTSLARLESGHTPSRRHPEYWGGDVPWIGIADAKINHTRSIVETAEKTNALGIANSSARILPKGTVCLSRTASVGYVVIMGRPMATSQDFVNWICGDQLDPEFLKYLFVAEGEDLLRFASGAVHQTIYFPEAKAFHVCHPPLPEQRRIVSTLDEAFAGLEAMRANAVKNLQNARELFEGCLNAVFNEKVDQWETERLNEHVEFVDYRGKTPPKRDSGVRLITARNVKMGFIQREPEEFIDSSVYDSWMTRGFPKKGDVLFTTEAPLGNVAPLDTTEKVVIGQRLITMKPDPSLIDSRFLAFMLMSKPLQDEIRSRATGATVLGIKAKLLKEVPIFVPKTLSEQQAIADRIEVVASESSRLTSIYAHKIAAVDELKQAILQKAFAGELTSAEAVAA